ncbi:MAG: HOG (high osmolarity glycerol) pathway protein [Icmadophila ericetorum]|nr:HOG (high osmolarity glycerol) pathway protein [Icmadophila ericetorum]
MSSYSGSNVSDRQKPSRPPSQIFPIFTSSLPYTLVRDFAYPQLHPLHYGPPAEASAAASGRSTPAYELQRRLSDPPSATWEGSSSMFAAGPWGGDGHYTIEPLPQRAYGDEHGPPYSEDEDLHSPVVVSARHKKSKSAYPQISGSSSGGRGTRGQNSQDDTRAEDRERQAYFTGTNGDGSETYYIREADEMAGGPGGELVTYPPDQMRQAMLYPDTYHSPRQHNSHFANMREMYSEDGGLEPGPFDDESRFSRDYQFTIASPDEEMHGKAVALFDFARENENELPLVEGQVILVSYRHGQGWLVAQDPETEEKGLVPEEYVRLLRDIEGEWNSGEPGEDDDTLLSPNTTTGTSSFPPTISTAGDSNSGHSASISNGSNVPAGKEKRPSIVSTFSTSSKDLNPYPHPLLGTQTGQPPPQVVHYGSQSTTPSVLSPEPDSRKSSPEVVPLKRESSTSSKRSKTSKSGKSGKTKAKDTR